MKILTICPSYNRPNLLAQMKESFYRTATVANHKLIVIADTDKSITQCFNNVLEQNPGYDFYHQTNDDVVYKTIGWDKMLSVPDTISYGDDGFQGAALCTFPMIDAKIINALGWIQQPGLKKYCGDLVWQEIGQFARCLNYVSDVKLEHHHFYNNKRQNDDPTYEATYQHDLRMTWNWKANDSISDIKKVKGVLYGH